MKTLKDIDESTKDTFLKTEKLMSIEKTSLPKFSVLLSVYAKESPLYFKESLQSIFRQTLLPSEFIVICDGPLTEELDEVICQAQRQYSELIKVFRLRENGGLGNALNKGLTLCENEIVVRMDSDDIAFPERCERQLRFMATHPEVDVLSCTLAEFNNSIKNVQCLRRLPEEHRELSRFARLRCPANHPSVVFRKSKVLNAGGYQHFYLFEDYYLWARMLMNGAVFHSLPEPLLYFRMNDAAFARRRGKLYNQSEWKLQREFLRMKFTTPFQFIRNIILRMLPRYLPTPFLSLFYHYVLRKRIANSSLVKSHQK